MPDLTENNMDDLFRRAAEQYPLRTDSADWSKVAQALDEDDDIGAAYFPETKTGYRKWLLLLLLPLAAIGYFTLRPHTSSNAMNKNVASAEAPTNTKKATTDSDTDTKKSKDNSIDLNKNDDKSKMSTNPVEKNAGNIPNDVDQKSTGKTVAEKNATQISSSLQKSAAGFIASNRLRKNISGKRTQIDNDVAFANEWTKKYTTKTNDGINAFDNGQENMLTNEAPDLNIQKGTLIAITPAKPVINLKDPVQKSSVPLNKKPEAKKNSGKTRFFYVGALVAPDLSMIKFQSVNGAGYTAGILLGYKFSSKFAIESGAYLESKKYYTKGEYFSTKNVNWLNYIALKNVNGVCNMIDVPFNLRYGFSSGKKGNWFAAAGLSTYFMFKENYTYSYEFNGSYQNRDAQYTKGSQNWFSVLNFSAGYEYNIGKAVSLRAEPYLKIPLAGMGTGNLPIMSAGLNLGIIHRFK
jgi:hypothetical protein